MTRPLCEATTADGDPCKLVAMHGDAKCQAHSETPPGIILERKAGQALAVRAEALGLAPRIQDRQDYTLLLRELVSRNLVILRDVGQVLEDVKATATAQSLVANRKVLDRWESTTATVFKLIQTAAILDPADPDEDHISAGMVGVERLLEAMENAQPPGDPCPTCSGSGRVGASFTLG